MTRAVVESLSEILRAEPLLDLPEEDRHTLGLTHRQRIVRWSTEPLNANRIVQEVRGTDRVLVVVNTVDRAITLGQELRSKLGAGAVRILHSRFYRRDRDRITAEVLETFGPHAEGDGPRILVATQVVEVGLDISAETLLTELAPANALVQRWGRCARWGGAGTVLVVPPLDRGYPYVGEPEGEEVLAATRSWLEENAGGPDGCLMGEAEEQQLIECGHGQADARWLDGLRATLTATATHISSTVRTGEYANAGLLIRNVDQRKLITHGEPDALRQPHAVEGFGLRLGTLLGLAKRAGLQGTQSSPDDDGELVSFTLPEVVPWSLQVPIWPERGEGSNARPDEISGWRPVSSLSELRAEPVVLIHPSLVSYSRDDGLQLRPGESPTPNDAWARSVDHPAQPSRAPFAYQRETAQQHVSRTLDVLHNRPELWPRIEPLIPDIEAWLCWPPGLLHRVVEGSIVAHDTGKLTRAWQEGIREVQRR